MLSPISWYGLLQPKISQEECQRSPYLKRCKTHLLWFALNTVYCILHYMRPSVRAIPKCPRNGQSWNPFKMVELHSTGQLLHNQGNIRVLPFAISHYSHSYWNQIHFKFRSSLHSLNLPLHIWDFMLNHIWFCYWEITQWVYKNYSQTCI